MKNTEKYNYFFSRIFQITFIYFTTWSLLLNVLYYMGVLRRYQESILFVTITVAFLGAVLVYIYPKKIMIQNFNIEIKGYEYQLFDLFCHQLPLFLLLIFYDPKIKPDNLLFDKDDNLKIIDFGLAREHNVEATVGNFTQAVGTPFYM